MPRTKLNRYMMQAVAQALVDPHVVLYMTDVSRAPYPDLAFLRRAIGARTVPVFWLLNKIDLIEPPQLLPLIAAYEQRAAFAEIIPLAARRGEGVPQLLDSVVRYVPEGPPYFPEDMPTDRDERFFIAELIREQVMLRTHEEVPYAVAVDIEALQERRDGGMEIDAAILVEKTSQKGILVCHHGHMIKDIGTHARQAIMRLLHCPVHLRLIVRVKQNWREHDAVLRDLGFREE
jgi:GTP-binding protein Era